MSEKETDPSSRSALLDDERSWLVVAVLAGSVVVASYYVTHPYPAYASALFLHMAEFLIENGYHRPERIPLYTEGGIPFAYPPLMFYALAFLIDIGIDPLLLSRALPGIAFVLALIPYFYLAREFLPVKQAGFATTALAVLPQSVRWHITGGGTVRGPAFLLTLVGLYVGVRLFKTGNRRLILPAALLYGMTMLTHPVYTAYFGLSYLVLFAIFSRSLRGLLNGAAVATGGMLIGAPWWLFVSRTHGYETILNASGTHGGLGQELEELTEIALFFRDFSYLSEAIILGFVLAGALYMIVHRRYGVLAWLLATEIVIAQQRYALVTALLLVAAVVAGGVIPRVAAIASKRGNSDSVIAVLFAVLILTMTAFGALYAAGDPPDERENTVSAYVDGDDIEAMEWIASETPKNARFAVLGDQAEWFPYVADRTSLVGPWGVEWTSPEQYEYHRRAHSELTHCDDQACVRTTLDENDIEADYVYVPKGEYTFAAIVRTQDETMRESMIESDRYELVYENDGAMVFRVTE